MRSDKLLLVCTMMALASCAEPEDGTCDEQADEAACLDVAELALQDKPNKTHTVTLRSRPSGQGTFAISLMGGADCDGFTDGSTCTVPRGGSLVISAFSSEGYVFDRWSGCSNSRLQKITLSSLHANTACVARFKQAPTVLVSATVQGLFRETAALTLPDGTYCGPYSCYVPVGGSLTVEAPASSSAQPFLGWSGCSDSKERVLVLTNIPAGLPTCVASYGLEGLSLSWSVVSNPAGGSVRVFDAGNINNVCTESACEVIPGSTVYLGASPDEGYRFVTWSGCSGDRPLTESLLGVMVNADTHCEARFEPIPATP
jgi:hypothetical protein